MSELDPAKLDTLIHQMVGDMGAAALSSLVVLGDRLGLYKALAGGPMTSEALANATGTTERYVREWCAAQAASGYITYDPSNESFSLSPEQTAVFAADESPAYLVGGYWAIASMNVDEPKIANAFKTGEGVGWGEHCNCLFCGTEKFFRPGYIANLVGEWLPALDGVVDKLNAGGKVADVGCGHGASTIVMAEAFPNSEFIGYDFHGPSIECANERAKASGLSNVRFETVTAKEFPGDGYDLVAFFDCLHDMGDPVGALSHVRDVIKPDGTLMVVEPFAHDATEDNLNPIGRLYYSFSTMICTPASLSQEVGLGLGAQAGPKRLTNVINEGGFSKVNVAAETPFNLIIEGQI